MHQVTIHEAKTHLSRLLNEVQAGGEIIVARGREPIAKLVAIHPPKRKRVPGRDKGKFLVPDDFNSLPKSIEDAFYR